MTLYQIIFACELVSTVLGLVSVYLLSKGDGRGWSIGAVMIILMGIVFGAKRLYGSAALQVFFLVTQFFGWKRWKEGKEEDLRRSSRSLSQSRILQLVVLLGGSWLLVGLGLEKLGAVSTTADAFASSGSVLAQTLMIWGYRECWLLWLAVDVVYVFLNIQQELYLYTGLYVVFCALAWNGWREWTSGPPSAEKIPTESQQGAQNHQGPAQKSENDARPYGDRAEI